MHKRDHAVSLLSVYHCVQGNYAATEEALDRIATPEGRLYVYSVLAMKSKEIGKLTLARQYLEEARKISNSIIFEKKDDTQALQKKLVSTKDPDEWLKITKQIHRSLESIVSENERNFFYSAFIKSQLVFGFVEESYGNALKLSLANYKDKAMEDISLYYIKKEKPNMALKCLEQIHSEFILRETYYSIGKTIANLQMWSEIEFWENIL